LSEAFRLNDIKFLPLDSTLKYLYLYFYPYFYFESSVQSQYEDLSSYSVPSLHFDFIGFVLINAARKVCIFGSYPLGLRYL